MLSCVPALELPPNDMEISGAFEVVQELPLYSSVKRPAPVPPTLTAAVCVPATMLAYLPVPKLPPAVQLVPSYSLDVVEFLPDAGGNVSPPQAKPVVKTPHPLEVAIDIG